MNLLLTANIKPNPRIYNTARFDPVLRRRDYEQALKFYLGCNTFESIVFVENSGADLTSLQRIVDEAMHDKKVEFISFVSPCPPERGKGYAELQMIDHAFQTSEHLSGQTICKITGRLIVRNIEKLASTMPPGKSLYCDLRSLHRFNHALKLLGKSAVSAITQFMETRVFFCTPDLYRNHFMGTYEQVASYEMLENHMFRVAFRSINRSHICPRFYIQPIFSGIAGSSNRDYQDAKYKVKQYVRSLLRWAAPFLWV
jgi:hypothetical protein